MAEHKSPNKRERGRKGKVLSTCRQRMAAERGAFEVSLGGRKVVAALENGKRQKMEKTGM